MYKWPLNPALGNRIYEYCYHHLTPMVTVLLLHRSRKRYSVNTPLHTAQA